MKPGRKPQSPRAVWSKAIQDLLADGRWHDRAELIEVGARAVPPGVAWRRAEQHRVEQQTNRGAGDLAPRRSDEHAAIEAGARRVAGQILYTLERSGKVLREDNWYCLAHLAVASEEVESGQHRWSM